MKVRCAGCRQWGPKDTCISFGLGWCCNEKCRWTAIERRRHRMDSQKRTIEHRGYAVPQKVKAGTRNTASSAKRRYVQERDGKCCRFCGTSRGLHIHHVKYRSEGGDHEETNLVTLCLRDHDLVHSNKRRWQPVLIELLRQHYEEERFMTVPEVEAMMAVG